LAPVDTLATDLAVGAAPPERAGAASAITETSAEFGGALGIAVLGVVGTAVYRAQMAEAVPAGVPDQAAAAARDTLGGGGGGGGGGGRPPPRAGRRGLLEVTREAFTQGLHLAAVVSAAAALAFAVLVVVLLRGVRPSSQPDEQPDVAPGPGGPRRGGVEQASGAASGSSQRHDTRRGARRDGEQGS
jgi:MFS transporter, DHA2 family, multidrug resistance protein